MRRFSIELKVGIFAIIVLSVLTFMTFKVGDVEWLRKEKGYIVYVYFKNIAGLNERTKVKVAGIDAGVIEEIKLQDAMAKLTLRINHDVKLYSNASAAIKTTGLFGDRYLEIDPGFIQPELKSGDTIKNVVEIADLDSMIRYLTNVSIKIDTLAIYLNEILATTEARGSLKDSISNLNKITESLNQTIVINSERLKTLFENIESITTSINDMVEKNREPLTVALANIKEFSGALKSDGAGLIGNLSTATKELKEMIEENRPAIKGALESVKAMVEENRSAIKSATESIDSIVKEIERGEGTLGKLIKDKQFYESISRAVEGVDRTISAVERLRTFINFQTDYLTKPKDAKGHFHLTLQPRPDKYYILGITRDPIGSVTTTEIITNVEAKKETKIEKEIEFTAQFAKRYKDIALRIGLMENTFGIGGDYLFLNDRGKISTDVWDFFSNEGAKNPHVRAGVDYFITRGVFLSAGVDNIMNRKWRGGYVGVGLRFED